MNATEAQAVLAAVWDPCLGAPLGNSIGSTQIVGTEVVTRVTLGFPVRGYEEVLQARLHAALVTAGWAGGLNVHLEAKIRAQTVQGNLAPLPGISNIVAVASGKGGVGKSTTAANLAVALAAQGARVGLLDADIYGPSQPLMMGLQGARPTSVDGKRLNPLRAHGVAVMSIGFLIDPAQPMVWRGPMATQALTQLLAETQWGELDYLLVDMPPGTGDIQLTLAQRVPVSGAIIVTTPQDVALLDARKGLEMFRKVAVPVLGIVENMATHICTQCGHEERIFGTGGGERMAAEYGVPLLGSLPLDLKIREQTDGGTPTVAADAGGSIAMAYHDLARRMAGALSRGVGSVFPTVSVSDD